MNLEEFTALVLEDTNKFEQLTHIQLTDDDLRITSMNRFASLERSLGRQLTGEEYRQLLQTSQPHLAMERELLQRPLTLEERIEHEELALSPYRDLLLTTGSIADKSIADHLESQNIKPTRTQLDDVGDTAALMLNRFTMLHANRSSVVVPSWSISTR